MTFVYFILAGVLGGVLAGMGMGGGTLTLPILVLIMGVSQLTAQFANLIAFLPSGSTALVMHATNGLVSVKNIAYVLIPSVVSCAITCAFVSDINGDILKKLFGGFLVVIAISSLIAKLVKK